MNSGSGDLNKDECAICLEPLEKSMRVKTPCEHEFHLACMQLSLAADASSQCPLCRGSIADARQAFRKQQQQSAAVSSPQLTLSVRNDPVDHEALKKASARAQQNKSPVLEVSMQCELPELVGTESAAVHGMISVKSIAPSATSDANDGDDAAGESVGPEKNPVDLVCVVDHSGSMSGAKMSLLHVTLKHIISELKPTDRISIVGFSDTATVLCGLTRATPEKKLLLNSLVERIAATGGTDIVAGLRSGINLLKQRADSNPVTSLLLLTDGQDHNALLSIDSLMRSAPERMSVHTFGYGADHDAAVMSGVAERGKGTFAFIEALHSVGFAFAATLGGLNTTCAVDIDVEITAVDPMVKIAALHTKFEKSVGESRWTRVKLPDLFIGESRDLVFELQVPRAAASDEVTKLLRGTVAFSTPLDDTRRMIAAPELILTRPTARGTAPINVAVNTQRQRVCATNALERAAKLANTDLVGARVCLQRAIAAISASPSAAEPLCVDLLRDLNASLARLANAHSLNNGGMAQMQSRLNSHAQQRSVVANFGAPQSAAYGFNAAQQCGMTSYASIPVGPAVMSSVQHAPHDYGSVPTGVQGYGHLPYGALPAPVSAAVGYGPIPDYGSLPVRPSPVNQAAPPKLPVDDALPVEATGYGQLPVD